MKKTSNRKVRKNKGEKQLAGRRGFGLNEVIGIAAGIIIAAVIVIPGLQTFASSLISNLQSWWTSMSSSIFATTVG
ncbi:MAG: hypothetical protein SCM11_00180 [Bacillota bacterium]|nr:hypothetical protein [Bacillota bacterium]